MRTVIDLLELRDDVEAHVRELIFEQLEEERKEVLDGRVLAEERGQAGDLITERGANMLRRVGRQVAHARHQTGEDDLAVDELGEPGDLAGRGGPDLGLVVLEQVDVGHDEVFANNVLARRRRELPTIRFDEAGMPSAP